MELGSVVAMFFQILRYGNCDDVVGLEPLMLFNNIYKILLMNNPH